MKEDAYVLKCVVSPSLNERLNAHCAATDEKKKKAITTAITEYLDRNEGKR